jgi:hypothetical protein
MPYQGTPAVIAMRRNRIAVPAALLVLLAFVAALKHQTESRRLRTEQYETVARLRADLAGALDCAAALQDSAVAAPSTSPDGDTLIFYLPAEGSLHGVKQIRVYVDQTRGGLWQACQDCPPVAVANAVDGLSASIERVTSGGAMVWLELRGRVASAGELPIRRHVFRSIPVRTTDVKG